MQQESVNEIIEWISREKSKAELRLKHAYERGDALAAERLEEKIHNYEIAIMVIKATNVISEENSMMKESEINTQCDRCSKKYREKEGCPKEKGCGGIILLACRIQSMEYDHSSNQC